MLHGLLLAVCLGLSVTLQTVASAQEPEEEARLLKAVFIYNFAKFTRWPDHVLSDRDYPLTICTAGSDEMLDALARLAGRQVQGRQVVLQPIDHGENSPPCHLLYIATSERNSFPETIAQVNGDPVLTISELPGFARGGGVIELYREQGRIRFLVNLRVARERGLEISSRLLNLAEIVNGEGGQ
ncbi:YfiR family protein [Candidatus Reidiella endopervernicosa]|uniref:YfiR family protein n=1 Tax=Candidatus Reidiella endopervernicosa TaxID=2738883 RepID=UPI001F2F5C2A|nr:YfiR family protein [Candidatus Reidiella endopervernicosa]